MPEVEDTFFEEEPKPKKGSKLPWVLLLLLLVGAGAAGWMGFQELQGERAAAAAARKASDDANAKLSDLETAKHSLEGKVEGLEEENARLSTERDTLSQEVNKLKATYDSLEEKMKAEIKKGEIRLSQTGGKLRVDLVDKVLFDSGHAELSAHGEEVLSRIGSILAKVEDKQIQVSGHTDDSPIADKALIEKYPTNWELSVARAVNVVRFMSEKAQVPSKRLVAAGYGQFHPIATNANPQGRARNRRIEILLTPALDAKPSDVAAKTAPAAVAPAKVIPAKATGKAAAKPAGAKVAAKPGSKAKKTAKR